MNPFSRQPAAGKYSEATKPRDEKPAKSSTECQANGCPLPGVYRTSNETSLCCVHDGEDPHLWAGQTERILGRLRLWWLALGMSNALPGEPIKPETVTAVLAEGGPGDTDVQTQRGYAATIRSFLLKDCKGERKAPSGILAPIKGLVAKLTSAA